MNIVFRQFVVYVFIGFLSAAVDIGVMQALIFTEFSLFVSTTLGFIVGLVFNYMLHARFTFGVDNASAYFFRYMFVVLFGYMLTITCVFLAERFISAALIGKVFSLPLVAVVGFFLGKYWVFKSNNSSP